LIGKRKGGGAKKNQLGVKKEEKKEGDTFLRAPERQKMPSQALAAKQEKRGRKFGALREAIREERKTNRPA